ncbi:MAG: hypothetical protein ACXV48_07270, partial [Halobacteriota archaeon]
PVLEGVFAPEDAEEFDCPPNGKLTVQPALATERSKRTHKMTITLLLFMDQPAVRDLWMYPAHRIRMYALLELLQTRA